VVFTQDGFDTTGSTIIAQSGINPMGT